MHEPRTHARIPENLAQFRVRSSARASEGHGHCCRHAVGGNDHVGSVGGNMVVQRQRELAVGLHEKPLV